MRAVILLVQEARPRGRAVMWWSLRTGEEEEEGEMGTD